MKLCAVFAKLHTDPKSECHSPCSLKFWEKVLKSITRTFSYILYKKQNKTKTRQGPRHIVMFDPYGSKDRYSWFD